MDTRLRGWTPGKKLAAASAVVVLVAAFLPWASLLGLSVSGVQGDGKVTAALAVLGLGALVVWDTSEQSLGIVELVAGGVVTSVALGNQSDISAVGLYLTLLAGIAWAAGGVMMIRSERY